MRRALGLTLLLFAVLAAPAFAQSEGSDACRQISPTAFSCTLLDKVADFAKHECRRQGLPAEACALPLGHEVAEGAVERYRKSWVHRAAAFQYRLSGPLPVLHAAWLGTHNSFNANQPDESPTLSRSDSNQQLTLTQQLDIDIRSVELDLHLVRGVVTVCHGRGPEEQNAGCTTEPPFSEVLPEIVAWLDANPRQVILLYLEDDIGGGTGPGYDSAVATLNQQLGSRIYKPASTGDCVDLPADVTRNQVRRSGARVVLVGKCAKGWSSLVFDWNDVHVESGSTADYKPFPDCDASYKRDVYDSKLVRYYEDSTFVSSAIAPDTPANDPEALTPEKAGAMIRCGVNLFGFDQLLPDDGRLKATIWSWLAKQPKGTGCAVMGKQGRWGIGTCRARPACSKGGEWVVPPAAVGYADAGRACRAVGARFALPHTGYQNSLLHAAAGGERVLLRYRRR
jgi:hypothetical protein